MHALAAPLTGVSLALHTGSIQARCKDSPFLDVAKMLGMETASPKLGTRRSRDKALEPTSARTSTVAIDTAHAAPYSRCTAAVAAAGNVHLRVHTLQAEEMRRLATVFGMPVHDQVRGITCALTWLTPAARAARAVHHCGRRHAVRRVRHCAVAVRQARASAGRLFARAGGGALEMIRCRQRRAADGRAGGQ